MTAQYNSHIAVLNVRHCPCVDKLRTDVECMKKERDDWQDVATRSQEETATASVRSHQAETKLDEAMKLLRQTRDWSVAIRALDSWHEHGQAKCDCPGHKRIEKLRKILKKMEDTFLAGLSTDTGDGESAVRQPERSIRGSNGELC